MLLAIEYTWMYKGKKQNKNVFRVTHFELEKQAFS